MAVTTVGSNTWESVWARTWTLKGAASAASIKGLFITCSSQDPAHPQGSTTERGWMLGGQASPATRWMREEPRSPPGLPTQPRLDGPARPRFAGTADPDSEAGLRAHERAGMAPDATPSRDRHSGIRSRPDSSTVAGAAPD
ncbi:hypothetical protein McPS_16690 [Marichromatium sp. PS1]